MKIEDTTGGVEALVFPSILKQNPMLWQDDRLVMIRGKLSDKDGEIKILVNEVDEIQDDSIGDIVKKLTSAGDQAKPSSKVYAFQKNGIINVFVSEDINPESLHKLKKYLNSHPGFYKVYLAVKSQDKTKRIETDYFIDYNNTIKKELEKLTGNSIEAIQA